MFLFNMDYFFSDSASQIKDKNCTYLIDVNFTSKDANVSRLKGQYVLVENCKGEKCKDPPFLNEESTFYEHQCNECNKIYLKWFEKDSRYEVGLNRQINFKVF